MGTACSRWSPLRVASGNVSWAVCDYLYTGTRRLPERQETARMSIEFLVTSLVMIVSPGTGVL
jgi:hypothetical protein